ncbi:acyltransferase [Flavobacterium amnicola]|uniref:Acyltransferase n=1 Tax=Flavobacterium amnicola TaxID=2506422 RepID=A0A4Q1K2J8_9FLAO|nr:acyltransferase [Flavobacterium amnicola]RXR19273.1 acyltransferase [Flavobacterium amnicola]
MNTQPSYYSALTGLRAIAAYMVFFHHYNPFFFLGNETIVYGVFSEMHIGVTLFFVLSGFLIAHNYYNTQIDFKKYMVNRIARIYPMYFVLTTLSFVLLNVWQNPNGFSAAQVYLSNITFVRGFSDALKFTGIAQGWSLTVEEVFYFLAPLVFLFLKKNKGWFLGFPILFFILGFGFIKAFNHLDFPIMENLNFMLDFTFFGRSFEFFAGVFLAVNMYKMKPLTLRWTWIGCFFILLSLLWLCFLKPNASAEGTDLYLGKGINTVLLPLLGFLPLFYGLISEETWLSRILKTPLFQLLGKSSYVFYLLHMGIFYIALNKVTSSYSLLFLGLNAISILLYLGLEKPLNNYIRLKF